MYKPVLNINTFKFRALVFKNPSRWKIIKLENSANNNNNFGFQTLTIF